MSVNFAGWVLRLCVRSAPVPETACPSDDMLGAHLEHALDDQEAARVVSHLDDCDACRAIVVAAVRDSATPRLARGTPSLHLAMPVAQPRALVGTRMGRYELRSLLGAGGMGQVYAAYDAELDRELAVKVLHPELARSAAVLAERLVRESRLMAKVVHPSVITVYDVGRTDDAVFIAMELVRGETLAAYLARAQPAWREIVALFERAGAGLAAAHGAGIVHRDFKPDNVLVEGEARKVVVTDFGIAMDAIGATLPLGAPVDDTRALRLTATGAAIGTPAYMAPEQLDASTVDERADVFAFSVSLWEALFGERPFRGKTVSEVRDAMTTRPRAPRSPVPARLVRALERGLAIAPADRWPDMPSLLRELAAVRARRRRLLLAASGAGLVGAGIAGALLLAGSDRVDPCIASLPAVPANLQIDDVANARLASALAGWRVAHAMTCRASAEPVQAPAVVTCLDARRTEIGAFIEEAQRSGRKASIMIRTVLDPLRCTDPRPGLLVARVPTDPAIRASVADLRYRGFDVEAARDRSDFATALPAAQKLADETTATSWPVLRAEVLYLLGTTQALGGDTKRALVTLREAAALAERAHDDYTATNSWIQLIESTTFDGGDPIRALEYASYADAALDRLGRPAFVEVLYLYYKGTAMVEARGATAEAAEPVFRRAIELAETRAPQYLDRALMGLAYLYEGQGKFADAIEVYRRALALVAPTDSALHVYHQRLATNLAFLGKADEAEAESRTALAIADKILGPDSTDRALAHSSLGQVLQHVGKPEEALVEMRRGRELIGKLLGERSTRYGEVLSLEAGILVDLHRDKEALPLVDRACEIMAFGTGDNSTAHADCLLTKGTTQTNLNDLRAALVTVDRALAILQEADRDSGRTGNAYLQRGAIYAETGKTDAAIADVERAIAIFSALQLDPGHLANAKFILAQILWPSQKERAKQLATEALALFESTADTWGTQIADIRTWLEHPR